MERPNNKTVSDYMKEAMSMANRSEAYSSIPEPEPKPVPEPKTQAKSKTKSNSSSNSSSKSRAKSSTKQKSEQKSEPKPAPEPKPEPKLEPEFDFEDIFDEIEAEEEEEKSGNGAGEVEKVENNAVFEANAAEEVKEEITTEPDESEAEDSKPSFEDYISRRNRSWERNQNSKGRN
jgi:hypothetical protein